MLRIHGFSKALSGVADRAAEQVHSGLAASRHTLPVRLREELLGISVAVGRTSIVTFARRLLLSFCPAGRTAPAVAWLKVAAVFWLAQSSKLFLQARTGPAGGRTPPRPGALEPEQAGSS